MTQATLSRDIRDLGLVKRAADGAYRRPSAADTAADPQATLRRAAAEFLRRVEPVQQLVVLRTDPGQAQPLAVALDRAARPDVVGTIGGDDTILAIFRTQADAEAFTASDGGVGTLAERSAVDRVVVAYSGQCGSAAALRDLAGAARNASRSRSTSARQTRLPAIRERALASGAARAHVIDARDAFRVGYRLAGRAGRGAPVARHTAPARSAARSAERLVESPASSAARRSRTRSPARTPRAWPPHRRTATIAQAASSPRRSEVAGLGRIDAVVAHASGRSAHLRADPRSRRLSRRDAASVDSSSATACRAASTASTCLSWSSFRVPRRLPARTVRDGSSRRGATSGASKRPPRSCSRWRFARANAPRSMTDVLRIRGVARNSSCRSSTSGRWFTPAAARRARVHAAATAHRLGKRRHQAARGAAAVTAFACRPAKPRSGEPVMAHLWSGRFAGDPDAELFALAPRSASTGGCSRMTCAAASRGRKGWRAPACCRRGRRGNSSEGFEDILSAGVSDPAFTDPSTHGDEDVHAFVERELVARVGDAGPAPAHGTLAQRAGRPGSAAVREAPRARRCSGRRRSRRALRRRREPRGRCVMPSYTHLRRAQPILVTHSCSDYAAALQPRPPASGDGARRDRRPSARFWRDRRRRAIRSTRRARGSPRLLPRRAQQRGRQRRSRFRAAFLHAASLGMVHLSRLARISSCLRRRSSASSSSLTRPPRAAA